ncbi:branched-chain amino acid transport system permease protein [Aminobacter lissarensis]|uniref:Branched-chain amino acid transport system permease protein n=1 Tax=Aminobacter carboxidus TaxID=376165 RepID=A0A8E2BCE6_9HYPH|nr:branched-chain amino acid ABC transporter permease [Aminobacter lissarensis]MBB6466119.1 branched-chain amino acid transport system permease protein [Aminobacter lissarensis]
MIGFVSYLVFFLTVALILGIATLGLNLQWGGTGLFNAGIVGFYAIGAYTFAILTAPPRPELVGNFELPWIVGLVGAMAAAALAALITGLATVRLRGDYLAVATFGIAITIQLVATNFEALTGGTMGIASIPNPFRGLFATPLANNFGYLAVVVVILAVAYVALERIARSPWGRVLKAIREDEVAAETLGKNTRSFRLQAFVIGSTLMGLAGALYTSFIGFISPFDFLPILTFQIWAMLIVGGSGNNRGAILGAIVVWGIWSVVGAAASKLLPVQLQIYGGAAQSMIIGLALVLVLLLRPRGLIGERPVTSRHAA